MLKSLREMMSAIAVWGCVTLASSGVVTMTLASISTSTLTMTFGDLWRTATFGDRVNDLCLASVS